MPYINFLSSYTCLNLFKERSMAIKILTQVSGYIAISSIVLCRGKELDGSWPVRKVSLFNPTQIKIKIHNTKQIILATEETEPIWCFSIHSDFHFTFTPRSQKSTLFPNPIFFPVSMSFQPDTTSSLFIFSVINIFKSQTLCPGMIHNDQITVIEVPGDPFLSPEFPHSSFVYLCKIQKLNMNLTHYYSSASA